MKCPHCADVTLTLAERQGIEIDYCPQCRGVWLDRSELDRLIERGAARDRDDEQRRESPYSHNSHSSRDSRDSHDSRDRYGRRRKSWLGELFD
ncbi:TFIIB-type zinc ribbon-containing protein [Paraburkholderia caballeronis]|uniref:Transcription factor zinc-finger domain-containing protein n=1 Tax=Paraburkholderia caballeronis TaxID=416943 RepID=A0A1H7KTJ5_9BURK|nr:zf-TFIIB domain-containing protein [Paraburkholderia caballeronis]PXW28129.1 hypothetical protein C7403_10220 [Paraburkholderia caballeronis]PXX03495.1 hypothetical protein C7407_10220 [Paraburkholderia caballeronis]RAK04239.1 hypothetical protein C7409_10220 [Paraburkholderia caballeronis]SED88167.1 hypothetical protein SAMN05445871_4159 [Paraburkholderia caballeronis]SEK89257.1 hypothetical protein SAMN05192542_10420 [Paraburkholderia caballeronis]